jgi:aromatic-L-amino-acid decarboxylase
MDIEEFRVRGKEMVDYICEFMSNIHARRVTPDVGPGYLKPLLPSEPPNDPESWDKIMKDVESKIMPGVSIRKGTNVFAKYNEEITAIVIRITHKSKLDPFLRERCNGTSQSCIFSD